MRIADNSRCSPSFTPLWLADVVLEHGWDATVEYLAFTQTELLLQRQGRGRPKNEQLEIWARDHFLPEKPLQQLAREAAERFGSTPGAARKRIQRTGWYKNIPQPYSSRKIKKAESPPRKPIVFQQEDLLDAIERVLRHGPAKAVDIAKAVNSELKLVMRLLLEHKDRFCYLPGDLWGLYE